MKVTPDSAVKPLSHTRGHRWFAASYDFLTQPGERRLLRPLRQQVVHSVTGRVLEIGAGTGANFPFYPLTVEAIVATEPDPFMLERARKRAAELRRDMVLLQCQAEALPFADASFDTIVATLVFCSVNDVARALAEARRVLKSDGTFRFIEHVRADGIVGRLQDALTPIQRRIAAGCHLNRRTVEAIEAAGMKLIELQRRQMLLAPIITGVARPIA
jgi:ubiquinone/menaquinone biosynthesis C-methylase UbiE